jgi:hypothetical protein
MGVAVLKGLGCGVADLLGGVKVGLTHGKGHQVSGRLWLLDAERRLQNALDGVGRTEAEDAGCCMCRHVWVSFQTGVQGVQERRK